MDQNELLAGELLYHELADALFGSKIIIFCLSKNYIESQNCLREFNFTMNLKKPYIPVMFCDDLETEFGTWPSNHAAFFMMADALYVADIYPYLKTPNNGNNKPVNDFIKQIRKKIDFYYQ